MSGEEGSKEGMEKQYETRCRRDWEKRRKRLNSQNRDRKSERNEEGGNRSINERNLNSRKGWKRGLGNEKEENFQLFVEKNKNKGNVDFF